MSTRPIDPDTRLRLASGRGSMPSKVGQAGPLHKALFKWVGERTCSPRRDLNECRLVEQTRMEERASMVNWVGEDS